MRLQEITDEMLLEALPHGSGIDASWTIERAASGRIYCRCSFHGMNQYGYYNGWQDFTVEIFEYQTPSFNALRGPCAGLMQVMHERGQIDSRVVFNAPRCHRLWVWGLRDYLEEITFHALEDAQLVTSASSRVIDPRAIA